MQNSVGFSNGGTQLTNKSGGGSLLGQDRGLAVEVRTCARSVQKRTLQWLPVPPSPLLDWRVYHSIPHAGSPPRAGSAAADLTRLEALERKCAGNVAFELGVLWRKGEPITKLIFMEG